MYLPLMIPQGENTDTVVVSSKSISALCQHFDSTRSTGMSYSTELLHNQSMVSSE